MLFQRMQCRAKQSEQQACKIQIVNYTKSLDEKLTNSKRQKLTDASLNIGYYSSKKILLRPVSPKVWLLNSCLFLKTMNYTNSS